MCYLQIPSEHHFSALVTTRDYPPAFDESYLGTTTFPLFMRIEEHHSHAPHTPAPCGGAHDGWDDGLANAFFPPHTRFVKPDARGVVVRIADDDMEYEYATHGTTVEPLHDPNTCAGCRAREEVLRAERARAVAAAHEELFARVGLARSGSHGPDTDTDGDDVDDEDVPPAHDPARVPPCTGIQDIIFTGAVRVHPFLRLN
jgi:hypothetical protein